MTEYDNLKFFTNKIIKDKKAKKFAITLLGDALEYALPDFTSTFTEISVRVNFDDSNNFTFELLLDNIIKNIEKLHINSKGLNSSIFEKSILLLYGHTFWHISHPNIFPFKNFISISLNSFFCVIYEEHILGLILLILIDFVGHPV